MLAKRIFPLALAALLAGAAPGFPVAAIAGAEPLPEAPLTLARSAADGLGSRLRALLGEEVARAGLQGAVAACADKAQEATREEAARFGVSLRRVSLRYRNSADAPDEFERAALGRFAAQAEQGSLPAELAEIAVSQTGDRELRYLRPIVLARACLGCHGQVLELAPGVAEVLAQRFPGDLATGYAEGELRGAFSVRVAMKVDSRTDPATPKVP